MRNRAQLTGTAWYRQQRVGRITMNFIIGCRLLGTASLMVSVVFAGNIRQARHAGKDCG